MGSPDILLFSPPVKEDSFMPMINAGLGAISGWLDEEGYEHDQKSLLADCRFLNKNKFQKDIVELSVLNQEDVLDYLRGENNEEITKVANQLGDMLDIDSYDVILISAKSDDSLIKGLPVLKERAQEKLVVIGGSCTSTNDLEIVRLPFIDYGVIGDGEIPISNILKHELDGEPLENDTGLVYVENGELIRGKPYKHPLDMKPKPVFNQDIVEKLRDISFFDEPILPYQFGRGCTQKCSFCNYIENQKFQYKSIDKAIEELRDYRDREGVRNIFFTDSNLFNKPDYVKKFAERVIEEELDIRWGSQAIILPRRQEFFDTLAEGGCVCLMHGIESASNSVLHRMRKAETRSMIENTLEKEAKAGIKPHGFFITDFPHETQEEYYETINFLRSNDNLLSASVGPLGIYKDREERMSIYTNPEEFGLELEEPEHEDFIDATFNRAVEYYIDGKPRDHRLKQLKYRHMQKAADYNLLLKNFGRKKPVHFLSRMFKKLYRKDYRDYSFLYA